MSTPSFHWLKQVSPTLMQWDQVPLYGAGPALDWDELSAHLGETLHLPGLKISHQETRWRNPDELTAGLGGEPQILSLGVANLEGPVTFLVGKSDLQQLMQLILGTSSEELGTLDADCLQGFYHFLAAQTFEVLSHLEFGTNLNPGILERAQVPKEASLSLDIEIALENKRVVGRLLISNEALTSWKQRFADRSLSLALKAPLAEKLQIIVHLEIGKTSLASSEWKEMAPGDFLILDHCSYDPGSAKGRVMLTFNGVPMFRAKLKQGSIKILEFPFYHEAEAPMNDSNQHDEEFDEEGEEEPEETTEVEEEEEWTEEEAAEEYEEEGHEEEHPLAAPTPVSEQAKEKRLDPKDIPLDVVIEVGRLQISVQKLMELEPGNTLELDIHPENGVDLVINSRRIGKGELLRIGDNLGVRILDIG